MAGEYCLEVTDQTNGCTQTACVTIDEDANAVFADAGENQFITCTNPTVTISGDGAMGFEYEYTWTTNDGCILTDENQLEIQTNCPGTYTLEVFDIVNNCSGVSTMTVIDSTALPMVDAGANGVIDCLIDTFQLDGINSDIGANFSHLWTTENGGIISTNPNELLATANAAGIYILTVTNTFSECVNADTAFVTSTVELPTANVSTNEELNCNNNSLIISGLGLNNRRRNQLRLDSRKWRQYPL